MATNDNELMTAAITLRWEARYLKGEHLSGEGAFLPELDVLDRDFAQALERHGVRGGKLLEIGAGVGRQAICYARMGFDVTAVDVSATAVEHARRAVEVDGSGPHALRFLADNILNTALRERFDVIADRGCYATLKEWELADYGRNVHGILEPHGLFLLKVNAGQDAMAQMLESRFRIVRSYDSQYFGDLVQGPPAVFLELKPLAI